jgi:N-acyl-phosphatidylethanolamine-hydrolysing phospholipase D
VTFWTACHTVRACRHNAEIPNSGFPPFDLSMHSIHVRSRFRFRTLLVASALLTWVNLVNAVDAPLPTHHRPNGFQNNYIEFEPKGLGDLLRWKIEATRQGSPKPPTTPIPVVAPDLAFIRANARAGAFMEPAITWVGHATMLAQFGGLNFITDPVFSERVSPVSFVGPRRHVPPGLTLAQLPHIDVVLISHNHYDHLDEASVKTLNDQSNGAPLFIVPLGIKKWLAAIGIVNAVELDWWQSQSITTPTGPVDVFLTPSQHWSGRGLNDRLETLWGSYAVFAPDFQFFFTGDTAYSKDFTDIHHLFASRQRPEDGGAFDIALIAIGAYEPRWFMTTQHVNPAEAVQIHLDLQAKRSVGVHWGTFELTDDPLDQPPRDLAEARRSRDVADDAFFVMAIGETRRLPKRSKP